MSVSTYLEDHWEHLHVWYALVFPKGRHKDMPSQGAHIGQMNSVNVNQGNVTGRPQILACLICLMLGVCKKPCKAYCFAATGATMDRTRFNIIVLHKSTTWLKCESFS